MKTSEYMCRLYEYKQDLLVNRTGYDAKAIDGLLDTLIALGTGCEHTYNTIATRTWERSDPVTGALAHHSEQIVLCSKCGDTVAPFVDGRI